jgi:rhodanese-related sulfurtransferase
VLPEALLVAVLGLAVSSIANYVSPRGLSLTRNYFPQVGEGARILDATTEPSSIPSNKPPTPSAASTTNMSSVKKMGIPTVTTERTLELFHDPEYQQELTIFVDARDNRRYGAGHIPGAYQLDRYYPQDHLATVVPACLNANHVVVYCTGGDCADSHFAAELLQDAGVPPERLFVYAGGIAEWEARHLPVEIGVRKSGVFQEK